ncbi:putative plasmid transfer protein [Escherichia coli]|uniref:Putative plasmid transfer protein n=1 Tax=Escherichia coli TaxID=562 RepID=A0A377F5K9_ECOLX|nr:putative plasmid transfer protein [Escherichia coli]
MDIKKAWENKTVRISVIGAALMVLIVVISQSIFTTPVKKEKKTQKKICKLDSLLMIHK